MPDLQQLAQRVREHIPLTRHLDFQIREFAADQLVLSAPLAPNINDKGTMFAGSQAALMALAGWCLTTIQAELQLPAADVLAMQNTLRYQRPVTGELTIVVTSPAPSLAQFRQRLARAERAVLQVVAEGRNSDSSVASVYQAQYMARAL